MLEVSPGRRTLASRTPPTMDLLDYVDRMLDNLRHELTSGFPSEVLLKERGGFERWLPALADIEDRGTSYEVRVDIPGVRKEHIDVRVRGHTLEIEAKEATSQDEKGKNYLRHERSYQGFLRTLDLPEDVVKDKISARCQDGVLTVDIPKKHPEPETKISVG